VSRTPRGHAASGRLLRTPDRLDLVTRIVNMGIEPFIVASSLSCVLAQRLVRRICPHCDAPDEPQRVQREYVERALGRKDLDFHRGAGCQACGHSGFQGRLPVAVIGKATRNNPPGTTTVEARGIVLVRPDGSFVARRVELLEGASSDASRCPGERRRAATRPGSRGTRHPMRSRMLRMRTSSIAVEAARARRSKSSPSDRTTSSIDARGS